MQKIAIIGGTGMTGKCVVDYALQKGLKVRLLYRNEATIPDRFKDKENLELVQGNAINKDDVKNLLQGVDAVSVILGTRNKLEATTELSTGTQNVIEVMKELDLRKFSICLSSFLFWEPSKVPPQFVHLNAEHLKMLELTKNSGLDYIAVMPPHIADKPSGEYEILHDKSPGRAISKFDLAKFFIDSLEQPEHWGKVCGIAKKA